MNLKPGHVRLARDIVTEGVLPTAEHTQAHALRARLGSERLRYRAFALEVASVCQVLGRQDLAAVAHEHAEEIAE